MKALDSPTAALMTTGVDNARSSKVDSTLIRRGVPAAIAQLPYPMPADVAPAQPQASPAPAAIVGLSNHRAGQVLAEHTGMFGFEDAIATIPLSRWDVDTEVGVDLPARFGGTLKGEDTFDLQAFQISPSEALLIDPQQRLLLEVKNAPAVCHMSRITLYAVECNN